ncbi:MAG: hypothetical protein CL694_06730 [Chloroflexi bacterium]|nr:hypothetical protein [Chloroflexota bacterium]
MEAYFDGDKVLNDASVERMSQAWRRASRCKSHAPKWTPRTSPRWRRLSIIRSRTPASPNAGQPACCFWSRLTSERRPDRIRQSQHWRLSMSEENKAFVRRWFDSFASGRFDELRESCGPGHVFHFPMAPVPLDADAHIGVQGAALAAIPDLSFAIERQIAEGDLVTTMFVLTGTHQAELQGLPATGNAISIRGTNVMRIVDGKNAEEWDALDTLAFMQQLGAIPAQE